MIFEFVDLKAAGIATTASAATIGLKSWGKQSVI
jgi:hypothetical protein